MRQLPRTAVPAMRRLVILLVIGAIVAVITSFFTPYHLALLIGWDVAALTYVVFVWWTVGGCTPEDTEALATVEDNTRVTTHLFLISAAVASLAGTGFELYRASESSGAEKFFLSSVGIVTVIASWLVVHSVFALRYAHEYYTPPVGGIDFKTRDERPDFRDFAYVAFTVGMTFQVSDTDVQSRIVRRTVLKQALISYLFGAVILAVTVNVIAGVIF